MANELNVANRPSKTTYVLIYNSAGKVVQNISFTNYVDADRKNYAINLTAPAGSSLYSGDMPKIPAGTYHVIAFEQLGANPASTDVMLGVDIIRWDGAKEVINAMDEVAKGISLDRAISTLMAVVCGTTEVQNNGNKIVYKHPVDSTDILSITYGTEKGRRLTTHIHGL